ncbi:HIT family protein [Barrientosiimonas marina]|uniref:HIT family protein n=1 Tax=Lentibacillus kimchii TaxID=1542911 RepID=A0ABW2UTE2_9BACI
MDHEDCIFCKIINGDIPSAKVYEDENVYAFLDISQVTKGHTLVVPKTHTQNIYETPPDVAGKLFERVPAIANAIKRAYHPAGMNLLNNNEKIADQSVFHLHIHLLPRYDENDGFSSNWQVHANNYSQDDLQTIAQTIGSEL